MLQPLPALGGATRRARPEALQNPFMFPYVPLALALQGAQIVLYA